MAVTFTTKNKFRLAKAPIGLQLETNFLFSDEFLQFLYDIHDHFHEPIQRTLDLRPIRAKTLKDANYQIHFKNSQEASDPKWRVNPVPQRLINRKLDLGDVSPANSEHFVNALNANVQGIQVDFDDGHCPTWRNQILGWFNVYAAVHNHLQFAPPIETAPILMLRPRAWNMIEFNVQLRKDPLPGPLVDFAMLMFHNARALVECGAGPFFYLSKVEGAEEARLWNDIFVWTQRRLGIAIGTIKACVLIENILSSFEMNEILFELREHSLGLNCGIWDYAASVIGKFGTSSKYLIPDRSKYVNMDKHFLKSYMRLVIQVCHARGAHATGGMHAQIVPRSSDHLTRFDAIVSILKSKYKEILEGIDGFMVYDLHAVPFVNELWLRHCVAPNQIDRAIESNQTIAESDLLKIPDGGVTVLGLTHNIHVTFLFILSWLNGNGHFIYRNAVEDSATAEISRSQIWQWIYHKAAIEDSDDVVTATLVETLVDKFVAKLESSNMSKVHLSNIPDARVLFFELVMAETFVDFITTFLNEHRIFREHYVDGGMLLNKL